jgi:hypothetical protein
MKPAPPSHRPSDGLDFQNQLICGAPVEWERHGNRCLYCNMPDTVPTRYHVDPSMVNIINTLDHRIRNEYQT